MVHHVEVVIIHQLHILGGIGILISQGVSLQEGDITHTIIIQKEMEAIPITVIEDRGNLMEVGMVPAVTPP